MRRPHILPHVFYTLPSASIPSEIASYRGRPPPLVWRYEVQPLGTKMDPKSEIFAISMT
jgi:hypothetical protein